MPNGLFTLTQQAKAISQGVWVNGKTPFVNYLVVGGGGGAGASNPGGGGAGGLLQGITSVVSGSAITVTVGAGGNGTSGSTIPGNGSNSVFGSVLVNGGGAGANASNAGASGGSGGGSGALTTAIASPGQGIPNLGNRGGFSFSSSASGGGGGAGTVGLNGGPNSAHGGNGGAGVASDISGTRTTYAGGGGGTGTNTGSGVTGGFGGAGGGGASSSQFPAGGGNGQAGTANTGGGGGVAPSYTGGGGGSGIVIISYPDTYQAPVSTTGSPTVSTSGSGSIAFNGTNQALIYPASTNYAFGTGDFTVEMYVYRSNTNGIMLDARSNAVAETWAMYNPNGKLNWYTGPIDVGTPSDIPLNSWAHIAVCRSGTTTRLFINGVFETSFTDITNYTTANTLKVGVNANQTNNFFGGNMSNVRITKGVALYTASFTPSSAPLSRSASTGLLLSAVSGSAYADSSGNATISSAPNSPPWSQLSPFATGLGFKNRVYTWTSSGSITF